MQKRNGRRGPVRICLMGLAAAGTVWGAVYMIKNGGAVLTAFCPGTASDGRKNWQRLL